VVTSTRLPLELCSCGCGLKTLTIDTIFDADDRPYANADHMAEDIMTAYLDRRATFMSNPAQPICPYCFHERENLDGWHTCNQAQDRKTQVEARLDAEMRIAYRQDEGYVSPEEAQQNYLETMEPYDVGR